MLHWLQGLFLVAEKMFVAPVFNTWSSFVAEVVVVVNIYFVVSVDAYCTMITHV